MYSIRYIYHDCFVVETQQATIVFDYWKDPSAKPEETPRFIREADRRKPLYVVVSHFHKDHFNPAIFSWAALHPDIRYILSRDIAKLRSYMFRPSSSYRGIKPSPESVIVLSPGESFDGPGLSIRAFDSTDTGNSYLLSSAGRRFFHAGDLNAWIWKDESTPEEVKEEIAKFEKIVKSISDFIREDAIDAAMFPVDSRIGTDYFTGAAIFCRRIFCRHFFPMHFGLGDSEQQQKYQQDALRFDLYAILKGADPETEYIGLCSPYSLCFLP